MTSPGVSIRIDKGWIQALSPDQRFQLGATCLYLSKVAVNWYVHHPTLYAEAFGIDNVRLHSLPNVGQQNHIAELHGRRQREWKRLAEAFAPFFSSLFGGAYNPLAFMESAAFDDYLSSREFHTGRSIIDNLNLVPSIVIGGEFPSAEHRFYIWATRYFGLLNHSSFHAHGDALYTSYARWLVASARGEPTAIGALGILRVGVVFRSMSCARRWIYIPPNLDEYHLLEGETVCQLLERSPLVLPTPANL